MLAFLHAIDGWADDQVVRARGPFGDLIGQVADVDADAEAHRCLVGVQFDDEFVVGDEHLTRNVGERRHLGLPGLEIEMVWIRLICVFQDVERLRDIDHFAADLGGQDLGLAGHGRLDAGLQDRAIVLAGAGHRDPDQGDQRDCRYRRCPRTQGFPCSWSEWDGRR